MISLKSASERERERVMYSKRMIKLVRCGYSRQLSSTCFLLFLSVLLWLFFCNDVTAFCSLFFHLSRLISLLFASGLKIGHGGLFFHFFHFLWRWLFLFLISMRRNQKETKFLIRDVVTVATHSYAFESPFNHKHTLLCIYLCNLQNPKSTLD